MRQRAFLIALLLLAFGLGATRPQVLRAVHAANGNVSQLDGSQDSAYATDNNYAAFRSSLAVVDTLTTAGILATPEFTIGKRTTLMVGARLSSASATVSFQIVYVTKIPQATSPTDTTLYTLSSGQQVHGNTIKGYSPVITLTGDATEFEGSYYPSPDYLLDSERAVTARLIVRVAPSGGATCSFWVGS